MAGPGGGGRSGGFGGGGSRGSGGGFGGGPGGFRGGHHHHHFHYGYPRGYYYGGGILSLILAPIIIGLVATLLLVVFLINSVSVIAAGGEVVYDEATFQDYANDQYYENFGSSSAEEDNMLIVFLTEENCQEYYCIAWLGDNIKTGINNMFGNDTTEFGSAVLGTISDYYAYDIDTGIASVMEEMADEVVALNLSSSFKTESDRTNLTESHIDNKTTLDITESTVNPALESFTEETGIPVVVVVETMENVFGKTMPVFSIVFTVVAGIVVAVCVVKLFQGIKERKRKRKMEEDFK